MKSQFTKVGPEGKEKGDKNHPALANPPRLDEDAPSLRNEAVFSPLPRTMSAYSNERELFTR